MASIAKDLRAFLKGADTALVEVASAKGSTPREKGAWMLVSKTAIFGTIGGGQLEYMAIDKARAMLGGTSPLLAEHSDPELRPSHDSVGVHEVTPTPNPSPQGGGGPSRRLPAKTVKGLAQDSAAAKSPSPLWGGARGGGTPSVMPSLPADSHPIVLSIPLGPEIGQCCGGRVEVSILRVDETVKGELLATVEAEEARLPHVYVFGGGHVGQALASAFSLLPLRTIVVESRADALEGMPASIETRLTPMPEECVRAAPSGAAFVVLTHDHALDFLIVAEALKREDTAYVGMIGSKTKKATFRNWYLKTAGGTDASFSRLVSPIGGDAVKDKRPAVIAALAAAEVMTVLAKAAADTGAVVRIALADR